MSYVFEGQTFTRRKDFEAAFPAYASQWRRVKAGITSIIDMEREIARNGRVGAIRSRETRRLSENRGGLSYGKRR